MRHPKKEPIADLTKWSDLRWAWQEVLDCWESGTRREWQEAEDRFWIMVKDLGLTEKDYRRGAWKQ